MNKLPMIFTILQSDEQDNNAKHPRHDLCQDLVVLIINVMQNSWSVWEEVEMIVTPAAFGVNPHT